MPIYIRFSIALAIGLVGIAPPAPAGPISARFFGSDFATASGAIGNSRFEGNPYGPALALDAGGFQGKVFGWLAIMRFQDQADFDANRATKSEVIAETPFAFSVELRDEVGRTGTLTFDGRAFGTMSFGSPKLSIVFDNPTDETTVGDATVRASLETVQYPDVNPAITFNGGVSIPPPLPIVTDILATLVVELPSTEPDPTDPGPIDTGTPGLPEPGTLTLLGLALGAVAARRVRFSARCR